MASKTLQARNVNLSPTRMEDFEQLATIRIQAMRESLERIGRFDLRRARQRLLDGFLPELTRHILVDGACVGFVAVKPTSDGLSLEHLYLRPEYQGRGIGSAVLAIIFDEADSKALPLRVGALRGSASNRFYLRHGFIPVEEGEWDTYYVRPAMSREGEQP